MGHKLFIKNYKKMIIFSKFYNKTEAKGEGKIRKQIKVKSRAIVKHFLIINNEK